MGCKDFRNLEIVGLDASKVLQKQNFAKKKKVNEWSRTNVKPQLVFPNEQ